MLLAIAGQSQNLQSLSIKKGVKLNGSVNVNFVGYHVQGIERRRDPLNGFATGNLNVDLFGYSIPLSFSYSNINKSYSQPFNQFAFTPQYKWVKTYVGYNSMTMSTYTLAGHVFFGGGVELTPGKWKIAAMYGRLRNAVPFDLTDTLQHNGASFKRMGYALKVGYETNGSMLSANIFSAKDEPNSIPFVLPENQLAPQQNVAAGLCFRKKFLKRFIVEGEYAVSAMNTDTRAISRTDTLVKRTFNFIRGLLAENSTSRYYDAINASAGYEGKFYSVRLKYEQVAPEYKTLGAYYFNNDIRNITLAPAFPLFRNRLNINANAGLQQNNLDNSRQATSQRFVSALNISFVPTEQWNVMGSYSNFTTYTNIRPQHDPFFRNNLDTLNFYQVNQNMNGSLGRNFGDKHKPQCVMLNVGYQGAKEHSSYQDQGNQTDFVTINASYSLSVTSSNLTVATSANYYTTHATGVETTYWGPTLSITKTFLEKTVRCSITSSYNETQTNNNPMSPVLNNRAGVLFAPKGREGRSSVEHNLSVGINVLTRLRDTSQQPAFTELTVTANYTYAF